MLTTQPTIPVEAVIAIVVSEQGLRKIMEAALIFHQARNVPFTARTVREIFMVPIVSTHTKCQKERKK